MPADDICAVHDDGCCPGSVLRMNYDVEVGDDPGRRLGSADCLPSSQARGAFSASTAAQKQAFETQLVVTRQS